MRADGLRAAGRRHAARSVAALALLAAAVPAAADLSELTAVCAGCHGEGGVSRAEGVPSLAGQPEYFLFDQLFYMREGVRRVEQMADVVEGLSDADIGALARRYAAAEPALAGPPPDAALVEAGAEIAAARRCASCHGKGLTGREAIPRVADQRIDYLVLALTAYRDGARRGADTTMTAAVRGLSDSDLEALAHYGAAQ